MNVFCTLLSSSHRYIFLIISSHGIRTSKNFINYCSNGTILISGDLIDGIASTLSEHFGGTMPISEDSFSSVPQLFNDLSWKHGIPFC